MLFGYRSPAPPLLFLRSKNPPRSRPILIGFSGLKSSKKGTFAETKECTEACIDVDSNFGLSKFVDKKAGAEIPPLLLTQNGIIDQ